MNINFTKEQYKDLLKMSEVAKGVYGILGDSVSEDYKRQSNRLEELSKYFLTFAKDGECEEFTDIFRNEIIPSDSFSEEMQAVMDDYDGETFWHELETRLGKRDLERVITDQEREEAKRTDWLPERVHDFYEKWEREFENYGVERLGVVENKFID